MGSVKNLETTTSWILDHKLSKLWRQVGDEDGDDVEKVAGGDGDVAFSSSLKSWNPCTREWKIVSILN
jgi:hypothetical protein